MLDTFGADQGIRNLLNGTDFPFDNKDLQAVIVIEVHMQGGKHVVKRRVLEIRKFLIQKTHVMIVDKSHRPDNVTVWKFPVLLNQFVPDKIAKSFRPVRISALGDVDVKLSQQLGIDGYADTA